MSKYFYLSAFFLLTNLIPKAAAAQLTNHSIQLSAGFSTHGTGDMLGVSADVGYDHVFNKRFDMTHALTTTIHSDQDEFPTVADQWNIINDRGINWTVAGMQITSMGHFAPISVKDQKLKFGGGVVFRYQSSSLPYAYGYGREPVDLNPRYIIYDPGPGNIFTIGYTFGITWQVKLSPKYEIGLKAMFQNDTNGDAITHMSVIFGRILPKRI
jgi:hypothetical protein